MFTINKSLSFGYLITQILISAPLIKATGAGILPFMKDKKGHTFFLLSEDAHRPGTWTDFGGTASANKDGAVKEGHEETMGVFTGTYKNPQKYTHAGQALLKRNLITGLKRENKKGKISYALYPCNVTQSVMRQGGIKKNKKKLYRTLNHFNKNKSKFSYSYREKINFIWVNKNTLVKSVKYDKPIAGKKLSPHLREMLLGWNGKNLPYIKKI